MLSPLAEQLEKLSEREVLILILNPPLPIEEVRSHFGLAIKQSSKQCFLVYDQKEGTITIKVFE